jgi:hypothetical protein
MYLSWDAVDLLSKQNGEGARIALTKNNDSVFVENGPGNGQRG